MDDELDIISRLDQILSAAPETEADAPETETPEIQPQAAPEAEQTNEGVIASEEAPAPAAEVPAPVTPETPKPEPVSSPELAQRLSEATQTQQQAAAARDQYVQRLNAIVPQLEAAVAGEFADIKTPEDVFRLMQTDPNRYNGFVIANTRLGQARQAQQQASQEAQQAYVTREQAEIHRAIPELADPEKGPAMAAKLRAYAKTQGIPDTMAARSAMDVIRLHREMTLAERVATYESEKAKQASQLTEANKKAAKAPPVQRPGAQRDTNTNEKASSDFSRFQKSGRLDDLADALQHIL